MARNGRPTAPTSTRRTFERRVLVAEPRSVIVPAWAYQWLVAVPEPGGSWVLPLDVQRRGLAAGTPTHLAIISSARCSHSRPWPARGR